MDCINIPDLSFSLKNNEKYNARYLFDIHLPYIKYDVNILLEIFGV